MNNIQDLIEKIINPPGFLKKNRRALFDTIRDIGELVKKDALTAFNAHFPYLADSRKLQEHGDALLIPHLLHDTEAEYRERVASASFFLMKAGERQYIMGQLKERFKNRYMIIEEFLNVHLKVTELTEDERHWALELLDSLLNPNIYTELSEWFHYIEEVLISDGGVVFQADREDIDFFDDKILRDGRILRDGKTAFNKTIKTRRDGSLKRNGRYGRTGTYTFPSTDSIRISRGSGYRDLLSPVIKTPMSDTQLGSPLRDGTRKRDGSYLRGYSTAFEELHTFELSNTETETIPSEDQYPTRVLKDMSDTHVNSILRDGSRQRNGMLQRANIVDSSYLTIGTPMQDEAKHKIWRDGKSKRDGSGKRTGVGAESMGESTQEAYTVMPLIEDVPINESAEAHIANDSCDTHVNSIRRDGTYKRDGRLQRGNIQDTSELNYQTAAVVENARYRTSRNGMMKRDGSGTRSGFGAESIYEELNESLTVLPLVEVETIGETASGSIKSDSAENYTNSVRRNGERKRDGALQRSNLLDISELHYKTEATVDTARYRTFRNGMMRRDGSGTRIGFGSSSIYEDSRGTITFSAEKDVLESQDTAFQMVFTNNITDVFKNTYKRDGRLLRDGRTRRSNFIIDAPSMTCEVAAMQETATIEESFTVGTRKHFLRDGTYLRDGSVLRNNNVLTLLSE